jgi:LytS/YehU family sensor histidine kinase
MPPAAAFATLPRNVAIVAVFNAAIAIALSLSGRGPLGESMVYSQCIGFIALLSVDVPRRLMWPGRMPPRLPMLVLSSAGMLAGFAGGVSLAAVITGTSFADGKLLGTVAVTVFAGIAINYYFLSRERLAQLRLGAEKVERGAVEARLKLLQAQIEPHFLFNTLANVHALIPLDAARAQQMLGHLDGFLRAALAAARKEHNTLADEFALLRDYLEILAIRMGSRLAFTLSLPRELSDLKLPPMLLQPLAENAVTHGLEPKIEGGRLEVSAYRKEGFVCIQISDTGLGLGTSSMKGSGLGLAHVRERLAAVYGPSASLAVESNSHGGATATIRIPE